MSERLGPEAVTALRRAERRWLDQARDRLRERPARQETEVVERDEETGR
ncbi:hypothetical protein [Nocardioides pantholopis]|nr:hypothetical protein [Nocardioides pantholopis]